MGLAIVCTDTRVVRLDYCMYDTKYRKRTRLMTNHPFRGMLCKKTCSGIANGRHMEAAQHGPYTLSQAAGTKRGTPGRTLDELHAYPPDLVNVIFRHITYAAANEKRHGVGIMCPEPVLAPLRT